jgi:acetate kinase
MTSAATILTLNGGSSSIKFAIYKADSRLERKMWGRVDRIGSPLPQLNYEDSEENQAGAGVISTVKSRVAVLVILTNEKSIIAKSVLALLGDRLTATRHDFNTALSGHRQPLSGINKGLPHFSNGDIHATKSQRS